MRLRAGRKRPDNRKRQQGNAARVGADIQKIRVLVVDDQVSFRRVLSHLLQAHVAVESIREAVDGEEAVRIARIFRPDVVLMDVSMPGMNGIDATKIIHSELPEARIIGLSMCVDLEITRDMLDAGAAAFLEKTAPLEALLAAIRGSG